MRTKKKLWAGNLSSTKLSIFPARATLYYILDTRWMKKRKNCTNKFIHMSCNSGISWSQCIKWSGNKKHKDCKKLMKYKQTTLWTYKNLSQTVTLLMLLINNLKAGWMTFSKDNNKSRAWMNKWWRINTLPTLKDIRKLKNNIMLSESDLQVINATTLCWVDLVS